MSSYFGPNVSQAVLLGPALAPPIGGITAHYYSWRVMQFGLFLFALTCLVLTIFFQPETSQPGARGIDKARVKGEKDRFVFLNPLRSLALLRSPNIALPVGLANLRSMKRKRLQILIAGR